MAENLTPKVRVIPAKIRTSRTSENPDGKKKRVCAYARVSTEMDAQAGSYELQVAHYTDFIKGNPAWEFKGVYADEGISGTSTKNRVQFQKMIQDCLDGKLDDIITKSISRFARNTMDCLQNIRQLKNLKNPVGVYFEKENIYTLDSKSELFLTILSSIAQEESRSISENTKWGVQKRFQRGIAHVPTTYFLGYDTDENGKLVINEEQAAIVRRIFKQFLSGKGTRSIAKSLMEDGLLTARGNKLWTSNAVYRILTNEKYAGNVITSKSYTKDFLTHQRVRNDGSYPQYYIKDHHLAIIAEEDFYAVQQELKRRNKMLHDPDNKYRQSYSGRSYFSNKIYCGECGRPVVRRRLSSQKNGEKYLFSAWQCRVAVGVDKNFKGCKARYIWESALEKAFMEMLYEMKANKEELLSEAKAVIAACSLDEIENARLTEIEQQLEAINERIGEMSVGMDSSHGAAYQATMRHLIYEQEILQSEWDNLKEKQQESIHLEKQLEQLLNYLDELEEPTDTAPTFRSDILLQIIKQGILYTDHKVTFELKCGIHRTIDAD